MYFEDRKGDLTINLWKNQTFPPHLHHDIEILVCTEGQLCVTCNLQTRQMAPGDISIAFPNDIHSYEDSEYGSGLMLIFNPGISPLISRNLSGCRYENFTHCSEVIPHFFKLLDEYNGDSCHEIIYGYLHVILGSILKKLPQTNDEAYLRTDLFSRALKFISDRYTDGITLKEVSRHCGVDGAHLSRVFSQKIPGGFCGYLHRLRIEHAKNLLKTTDDSIFDILLSSGFSGQRTFYRVFKDLTGMTPKEYRDKNNAE